jgi:hypothetical protein
VRWTLKDAGDEGRDWRVVLEYVDIYLNDRDLPAEVGLAAATGVSDVH